MRQKFKTKNTLTFQTSNNKKAKLLEAISKIISKNPKLIENVWQDLTKDKKNAGSKGLSADQVFRIALLKNIEGLTYDQLVFHLAETMVYRTFCNIGFADKIPSRSSLASLIKSLSPEVWEDIQVITVNMPEAKKIDSGKKARTDCTVVKSKILKPFDSQLLYDLIRVSVRKLKKSDFTGYCDRTKQAKRRMLELRSTKGKEKRKPIYKELLKVTYETMEYVGNALEDSILNPKKYKNGFTLDLALLLIKAEVVVSQTVRRVLEGESVPALEKFVSIFETHADIIVKDNRETFYGHKICLTAGVSNMIFDCKILDGNPADSSLAVEMIDRLKIKLGKVPEEVAMDGGFASKANVKDLKIAKVKEICFSKKRGMKEEDMCSSKKVYKKLWKFRAGVEGVISWLKRVFSLDECPWKSHRSFKSYVLSNIVAANFVTIGKSLL